VAVTAIAVPLGLFDWLPFIGARLGGGSPIGVIAILVLMVTLWVLFFVISRLREISREQLGVNLVRLDLFSGKLPEGILGTLAEQSAIGRRIKAFTEEPEQIAAARSELDHARSEVSYSPARALVWSLPALGFLGTAAEMSRAVSGLGNTVGGTTGYAELRTALVGNVIPPLGDAFGITLFALGASVICHLLLTWTNSREQQALLEVEDVALEVLAKIGPAAGTAPPAAGYTLNGQFKDLTNELSLARSVMSQSVNQISNLGLGQLAELAPLLQSVNQQLSQIHAELQRDLVLTKVPQTSYQGPAR
jgi:hypothetical protein